MQLLLIWFTQWQVLLQEIDRGSRELQAKCLEIQGQLNFHFCRSIDKRGLNEIHQKAFQSSKFMIFAPHLHIDFSQTLGVKISGSEEEWAYLSQDPNTQGRRSACTEEYSLSASQRREFAFSDQLGLGFQPSMRVMLKDLCEFRILLKLKLRYW